jgi:hypothetical protein
MLDRPEFVESREKTEAEVIKRMGASAASMDGVPKT